MDVTLATILFPSGAGLAAVGNEHKELDTTAGLSIEPVQAALKACQYSTNDDF